MVASATAGADSWNLAGLDRHTMPAACPLRGSSAGDWGSRPAAIPAESTVQRPNPKGTNLQSVRCNPSTDESQNYWGNGSLTQRNGESAAGTTIKASAY